MVLGNNRGFTLIEIIIVVTIILVVGGLIVPGIINFQAYQVEDTIVTNFVSTLRTYQNIAMTKDIKTVVKRSPSKIEFCEIDTLGEENCSKTLDLTDSTACLWDSNECDNVNIDSFYFDKYGNITDSTGVKINSDKELKSNNFEITLNKNGSITKTTK